MCNSRAIALWPIENTFCEHCQSTKVSDTKIVVLNGISNISRANKNVDPWEKANKKNEWFVWMREAPAGVKCQKIFSIWNSAYRVNWSSTSREKHDRPYMVSGHSGVLFRVLLANKSTSSCLGQRTTRRVKRAWSDICAKNCHVPDITWTSICCGTLSLSQRKHMPPPIKVERPRSRISLHDNTKHDITWTPPV